MLNELPSVKPVDDLIVEIACTTCHAGPGEPCVIRGGSLTYHSPRVRHGMSRARKLEARRSDALDGLKPAVYYAIPCEQCGADTWETCASTSGKTVAAHPCRIRAWELDFHGRGTA